MDIQLNNLAASTFRLLLPANPRVGARELALAQVVGLGGHLHTALGLVKLDGVQAKSGTVPSLSWPLGPNGMLNSTRPIDLNEVLVDASFVKGVLDGALGCAMLASEGICYETPQLRINSDLLAQGAKLLGVNRQLTTRVEKLQLNNLQLQLGDLLIQATAVLDGLRVDTGESNSMVHCAHMTATEMELSRPRIKMAATNINCVRGFSAKGGDIRIDELTIGSVRIRLELGKQPSAVNVTQEANTQEANTSAGSTPALDTFRVSLTCTDSAHDRVVLGNRVLLDLKDVDRLQGNAEISVYVKAQLPVVGKYRLDRAFKIPISSGQIDFASLEKQLGTIEDAFIDFAVREQGLMLIRDIPLLPTKGKTLVTWPLSTVERSLARHNIVSLRALTRAQLAKAKAGDSKATISTIKIDIVGFDVSLDAPPAADENQDKAELRLTSFESLKIDGSLLLKELEKQLEVIARCKALSIAVNDLIVGSKRIRAPQISADEIEFRVLEWEGLKPKVLEIQLKDLLIRGATIRDLASMSSKPTDNHM